MQLQSLSRKQWVTMGLGVIAATLVTTISAPIKTVKPSGETMVTPIEKPQASFMDQHSATHEYYQIIKDLNGVDLAELAKEYPSIDVTGMMSTDELAYEIALARTAKLIEAGKL